MTKSQIPNPKSQEVGAWGLGLGASRKAGFTLIELLVVIVILSILIIGLIMTFNPLTQYNKAEDGKREHDIGQIQRALDSYFNDTSCYPTSLTFGQKWSVNNQVYMEQVPQDPNCSRDTNQCYKYEAGPTNCPQWAVVYGSLRGPAIPTSACPLITRNNGATCLPVGFTDNKYNYCILMGSIDCQSISSFVIGPTSIPSNGGGGNGGGGNNNGPTATPTPLVCPGDIYHGCTSDSRCNAISPKTQCVGYGGAIQCYCDQHCNQQCQFN